jgi:hypothetical protein
MPQHSKSSSSPSPSAPAAAPKILPAAPTEPPKPKWHDVTVRPRVRGYRTLLVRLGRAHKDVRAANERYAYAMALLALAEFGKANGWNEAILFWLWELASALTDLDYGVVPPLLKPPFKIKAFSSKTWRRFALVSLGMRALTIKGISRPEAAQRAVQSVKGIGETKIVLQRYDEFQKGGVKNREAKLWFRTGVQLLPEMIEKKGAASVAKHYFDLANNQA